MAAQEAVQNEGAFGPLRILSGDFPRAATLLYGHDQPGMRAGQASLSREVEGILQKASEQAGGRARFERRARETKFAYFEIPTYLNFPGLKNGRGAQRAKSPGRGGRTRDEG